MVKGASGFEVAIRNKAIDVGGKKVQDDEVELKLGSNDSNKNLLDYNDTKKAYEELSEASKAFDDKHAPWKTKTYWALPENVRNAIDVAKKKSMHSEFWYKLENLNDKLMIFKMLFYSKMHHHQRVFYEKKKVEMEIRLKEEQARYEKEMAK